MYIYVILYCVCKQAFVLNWKSDDLAEDLHDAAS